MQFNNFSSQTEEHSDRNTQGMTVVLFGATGDLAKRKLFPALYNLYVENKMPKVFSVIGLGRTPYTDAIFQTKVEQSLRTYSRGTVKEEGLQQFLSSFRYCPFDATEIRSYEKLNELIEQRERELTIPENRLFYLSVAPSLIDVITSNLTTSSVSQTSGWKRLIVEKPFGNDLASARELNEKLRTAFNEDEIYRIDHYLGKPMVQNLETLILVNPVLDSLFNHKLIANVQITASETVGVETRASYYDKAGAIRDMVQNHMLQLVMMTALHLPTKAQPEEIRTKKMEIMQALRPIQQDDLQDNLIRAQYGKGDILGIDVPAYREEPGVPHSSMNDTYIAARLFIDNEFWNGIPFYIRTGKRLDKKSTRIVFEFKERPSDLEDYHPEGLAPNLLILEISPNESISLQVNMKDPSTNRFKPSTITFTTNSFNQPEAYELLLHDAILGNATFFANWKEVELSWQWIQPLLEAFEENRLPLVSYAAGSTGPKEAKQLLANDHVTWW
ncbi:glucose-6-phosphate dehydrogenase [Sporosarcina aquimarina]|uniref:glucose-6-phosphate dehydrogenase n=1 Tax=Sporosarcina aquimarina TaxID=114975 RepID=UPI00203D68D5|nr:glucose-6-phosphate dehydrogenase [Sporosarcina aquimarina]MCM3758345.1 glucose-6-phosphate dehydrogenase [Sporosarcina aquimarina]